MSRRSRYRDARTVAAPRSRCCSAPIVYLARGPELRWERLMSWGGRCGDARCETCNRRQHPPTAATEPRSLNRG